MKKYDVVECFGCSFTEGGGLNNPDFIRFLENDPDMKIKMFDAREYALTHSYPFYLSQLLGSDYVNHGISCGSNDSTFRTAYNRFKNKTIDKNTLVIIQTTLLSRMMLYDLVTEKYYHVNRPYDFPEHVVNYYKDYITKFYDSLQAWNLLMQNIELFQAWLASKNIDVLFMFYEQAGSNIPKGKHFMDFGGKSLGSYAHDNKLTLGDIPGFPVNDRHFSIDGHKHIAQKIYEHMVNNYD